VDVRAVYGGCTQGVYTGVYSRVYTRTAEKAGKSKVFSEERRKVSFSEIGGREMSDSGKKCQIPREKYQIPEKVYKRGSEYGPQ